MSREEEKLSHGMKSSTVVLVEDFIFVRLASIDNQAMKDEMKESNSTYTRNKMLVRMESAVSSVTSTQELVEASKTTKAGKLRAMITNCSRRMLLAIICLLSIGILTFGTLYVLEYHKEKVNRLNGTGMKSDARNCYEYPSDAVLDQMPAEVKELLPTLESDITTRAQLSGIKAASFGIAYKGKFWWKFNFGRLNFSNPNSPAPDSNTPFPVASISKIVTAVMLLKLLEKGVIKNIDDPVRMYDPQFNVINPFNKEQITFRQLQCMASGLRREAPCNPPLSHNFCPYNTTEMWKRISHLPLELRPNLTPVYSNLGYAILGRLMERILNGTTYEEWVQKEIFDKLDLKNAGFNIKDKFNEIPVSSGKDGKISRIIDWGWLRPAGGLYMSLDSLNKLTSILLEGLNTTFINKSSKRRLFTHNYESDLGCPFALAKYKIEVTEKETKYQKFFKFNGLTVGYFADIHVSPENTVAVYALFAHGGEYSDAMKISGIIGGKVLTTVSQVLQRRKSKYQAPQNMEAYKGTYKLASYWPMISKNVVIREIDGRLNLQVEWLSTDLTYVSPWTLKSVPPGDRRYCKDSYTITGLMNNIFYFTAPPKGSNKSPGFYVPSYSSFGYASFSRV
ncbi:uncharacterized protein LOC135681887 isoform X1 [Rhopilema esculentum]|uniref:uncharacterized protein LOC135681887 isoform X1 n=2 Tax=Rhopilema esculentum TaxID=499914 RepID=UPI0031DC7DC0